MSFFNDPPYTMFDSSHKSMDFLEIKLCDERVLPVWKELILTMRRFEKALLVASSEHCRYRTARAHRAPCSPQFLFCAPRGFGEEGIARIVPPNADIKFIIEVLDFIEVTTS